MRPRLPRTIATGLLAPLALAVIVLAAALQPGVASAQTPDIGCPPGWVARPPELNPALGPCVPGAIADSPIIEFINPDGCPPGWVARPPELNPALGPCVPGAIADSPIIEFIDPVGCPAGWIPATPPLDARLRCIPGALGVLLPGER